MAEGTGFEQFLQWEASTQDRIDLKMAYVDMTGDLVDAVQDRQALVDELLALETERRVLLLEIGELARRELAACLAIYEEAEVRSQREHEALRARALELRDQAQGLADDLRRMRNIARRLVSELGEQEYRKQLHALEVKEVKVRGQWTDVDLDQGRALQRLKTAQRKLEQVREERAQVIPFPDPKAA